MFGGIDKFEGLNIVSSPIISQFLKDYSKFDSDMDSISKIIEDY